jgi:NitT/TauT family transport system substrate-binding protein
MKIFKNISSILVAATLSVLASTNVIANTLPTDKVVVGFSHYTGWEPYAYIRDFGIMDQVNKEFGTNIEIRMYGTYDASLADYAGGAIHGVTMTNMDALILSTTVPSKAVNNGDTSHGNDGLVTFGIDSCKDLKGENVYLFTQSVSHYMLNRYLSSCGLTDMDITLKHVANDGDLPIIFNDNVNKGNKVAVVTWNPPLQTIMQNPKANLLFDSSKIEGEILDSLYIRNDSSVSDNEIKALSEMWYRAMKVMTTRGAKQNEMIDFMTNYSGATTEKEFMAQMKTTRFFATKESATKEIMSPKQKETMNLIIDFVEDQDLLGDYDDSSEIGVKLADGTVLGDSENIILEYTTKHIE